MSVTSKVSSPTGRTRIAQGMARSVVALGRDSRILSSPGMEQAKVWSAANAKDRNGRPSAECRLSGVGSPVENTEAIDD